MSIVLLIVGIVIVIFIDALVGGVILALLFWGLTIRFLAREANKGGAQRKKDDKQDVV